MQWSHHITNISNKASKVLNFLRRNLYKCSNEVKAASYLAIVRPLMEYASVVWDPHLNVYISMLEKIQRRAARWVKGCYDRYSSVTTMLASLKWPTLAQRRKIARLKLFYKIMYNSSTLILPPYYQYTCRNTCSHHHLHLIQQQTNTMAYQQSFFPRTIKDWNIYQQTLLKYTILALFKLNYLIFIAN